MSILVPYRQSAHRVGLARDPRRLSRRQATAASAAAALLATVGLVVAGAPAATADPSPICSSILGVEHCFVLYTYTGGEQQFTAPAGVESVSVTAIGAAGKAGDQGFTGWFDEPIGTGDGPYCPVDPDAIAGGTPGSGGNGAKVTGNLSVTPGQTLYIEVGGLATDSHYINLESSIGGWNGGGKGGAGASSRQAGTCGGFGGGGGGASDIQTCSRSVSSCLGAYGTANDPRRIVAAGGGGGGGSGSGTSSDGFDGGSAGSDGTGDGTLIVQGGGAGVNSDGTGSDGGASLTIAGVAGGGGGGGGYRGGGGGDAGSLGGAAGGGGGTNLVPSGGSAGLSSSPAEVLIDYVPPQFSSVAATTFTEGSTNSFRVVTADFATTTSPSLAITSGTLPSGVSLADNGDGTATLSGIPTRGSAGPHALTITASTQGAVVTQSFELTVGPAKTNTRMSGPATEVATAGQPATLDSVVESEFATSGGGTEAVYPNGGTVAFLTIDASGDQSAISGCGSQPVNETTGHATCNHTFDKAGAYEVIASYSGDNDFQPSTSLIPRIGRPPVGYQTWDVSDATSITVSVSGSQGYGDTAPTFSYQAPPSVTLTGSLSCSSVDMGTDISPTLTPGSYTVDGSSCSGLSAGSGTAISYSGVRDGFSVSRASQTVRFTSSAPAGAAYGGSYTPTATGGGSGNPVTFSIDSASDPGVCSLSGGMVSFIGVGLCVVDADQAGGTDYSAGSATQSFEVGKAPLTVTASSPPAITYGDPAPTITASYAGFVNGDSASSLDTAPTCSTTYTASDAPGAYDTACSGAADPNYHITYVKGTLTVGMASQTVRFTSTAPTGAAYGGSYTPTATGGGSGNPVRFSIPDSSAGVCSLSGPVVSFIGVGTCVVDADQAGNTDYAAATQAQQSFGVGPASLRITASSPPAIKYGDPAPMITPSYAGFVNGDTAGSLTSTPTCSTPYVQGSDVGTYVTSCSGAADPNYHITYAGGSLTVDKAATSMTAGDGQLVMAGDTLGLSATLSSSAAGCQGGQPVSFGVSPNPTGGSGSYSVSATTGASGIASTSVDSGEWAEGAYTVTASYAGDGNCIASMDTTTVTVAAPGDAASGGGWLTSSGSGRLNFAFTVRQVPHSRPVAYRGHLALVNNGKWKLAGTIGSYGLIDAGSTGVVAGSGELYWWNPALDGGLGDWSLAESGASFTARFTATSQSGHGKHATGSPGSFGITIGGYTPTGGQPALPDTGLADLKGGHISLS